MAPCYIVLGAPRTGTSLTMGILTKLGVDGGDDYREGINNPNYYEHKKVFEYVRSECSVDEMIQVLKKDHPWGMKHPTLANKWPQLSKVIGDPRFVVTHRRDFQAQFISHRKAIRKQTRESLITRTRNYYDLVDKITDGKPRVDIYFEDWFSTPDIQLSYLRLALDYIPTKQQNESALSLIDPNQRHQ